MKIIHLHGILKDKFGEFFKLDVMSAREATHAIACQLPEFKMFMLRAEQEGMRFAVFADEISEDGNLGEDEIDNITGASVIHVVPKIMGAGGDSGVFQVLTGIVLIGAAWFTGGLSIALAETMMLTGAIQIATGLASMLMPTPELGQQDEDGNQANYGFGGAVTTVAQGNPVPILIGERYIGGFICSAGIYTEDNQ
ncbi:tail assembly protein [Psychrobacter namhaensis]|uniref:Tail assembly protein n=1 Tax=Psychrobacter namhaensis TaxID=292734 RepID=A0ABW8L4P6_9GAMM